jgi:hypothetical protein
MPGIPFSVAIAIQTPEGMRAIKVIAAFQILISPQTTPALMSSIIGRHKLMRVMIAVHSPE